MKPCLLLDSSNPVSLLLDGKRRRGTAIAFNATRLSGAGRALDIV
jgi:hypothetical protein